MRNANRYFAYMQCEHQKSVRLDDFTYCAINNYRGHNFSEKLRNYVYDCECKKQAEGEKM